MGGRKHSCRCAVASAACTVAADFGGVSWVFREQKDRQGNPQGKSLRINAGVEFFGFVIFCYQSTIHIYGRDSFVHIFVKLG